METLNNRDYSGGLGIPQGSTWQEVDDSESVTGTAVIVTTPLGAVFYVRVLRTDDVGYTLAQMCDGLGLTLPVGEA